MALPRCVQSSSQKVFSSVVIICSDLFFSSDGAAGGSVTNLESPSPVNVVDNSSSQFVVAQPQFCLATTCGRLPVPYHFPAGNVGDCMKSAISNGEILCTGQRSELLEALYQD